MTESFNGPPPPPPAGPSPAGRSGRERGRMVLLSEQPLEAKLAAIAEGDPLGLFPLAAQRVRERSYYLDPDRVYEEGVFTVTALSVALRREDDFEPWLIDRMDQAIDHLLRRDAEASRTDPMPQEPVLASAEYLCGCWGLSADEAFRAAVRFNGLSERCRRTFFALLVDRRSVARCLEDGLGPRDQMREYAVRAIEAILGQRPESVPTLQLAEDRMEAQRG